MRFFRPISVFGLGNKPIVAGLETPVRWYRCAPHALEMPFPHAFGLTSYGTPDEQYESSIGDVAGFNQWDEGERPANALGVNLCGTREQWQTGFAWSPNLVPVPVQQSGIPLCCGLQPLPADGRFGLRAQVVPLASSAIALRAQGIGTPVNALWLTSPVPPYQFSGGFTAAGTVTTPTFDTPGGITVFVILRMRFGQPSDYINPLSNQAGPLAPNAPTFGPTVAGFATNLAVYTYGTSAGTDFLTCAFDPGDVVLWACFVTQRGALDAAGETQGTSNAFGIPTAFPLASAGDDCYGVVGSYSPTPPVAWTSPLVQALPADVLYTDGFGNQWGLAVGFGMNASAGAFSADGNQAGSLLYQWLGQVVALNM